LCLATQPLPSVLGEGIVLCSPVIFGRFPLALDESSPVQPLKRHKQRTRVHFEDAFAYLLDPESNPITMDGFERDYLQDEHVECALYEITLFFGH
jgi:hypothetical protein